VRGGSHSALASLHFFLVAALRASTYNDLTVRRRKQMKALYVFIAAIFIVVSFMGCVTRPKFLPTIESTTDYDVIYED
jgi:hypothetical protein